MDYFTIGQKQREWARNRAKINSRNTNLTNEQHRAIALLCHYRHIFHKNMECLNYPESAEYRKYMNFFLKQMPIMLHVTSLPKLNIPEIMMRSDAEGVYDIAGIGEEINSTIEDYLKDIDYIYGTWYAPTGYARSNYDRSA